MNQKRVWQIRVINGILLGFILGTLFRGWWDNKKRSGCPRMDEVGAMGMFYTPSPPIIGKDGQLLPNNRIAGNGTTPIPSPLEIQQMLVVAGYYDGKVKEYLDPNVMKAWRRYTCDREAERYMKCRQ